ncbi:MAG: Zn-dependent protease with chaperone function [Bradymonadia bacterium]|jgi:Zn-dependent protease with chaperone function
MFDFQNYVAVQKNPGKTRDSRGFGAYAYSGDVRVLNTLSYAKPVKISVDAAVRAFKAWYKSDLLGSSVKVSERQFPHIQALVSDCATQLGIPMPTTYIAQNLTSINAMTLGTETDSFILLHSATVDRMSEAELKFIVGHECGHIQNSHVSYKTALTFITQMAGQVVGVIATPARLALATWSRRAEITCDRAGLLCCGDLDVATQAMVKIAHGSSKLADEFDLEDFLAQADELREGLGRVKELALSHPYLPKRVRALRLFAQSDYYKAQIGESGGVPLVEIDRQIDEILRVF